MTQELSIAAIDQLFLQARSHNGWADEPVSDEQVRRLYELTRQGPTAFNCCPARFVFVRTLEGKERVKPALMPNNVDKVMSAPLLVIVGTDSKWFEVLPELFKAYDISGLFRTDEKLAATTALRNGSLQGAYLMLAARALGLDVGPMSGFNSDLLDKQFFPDGRVKSNFICAIGHGKADSLRPRGPRLDFEEACEFA